MTEYHLVTTPQEYSACHRLIRELGVIDGPLTFPTVYAKRDGEVVGVAGRGPRADAIILYRLVTKCNPPGHILIKLVEAFEEVLQKAGVTFYLVAADKSNQKLNTYIQRILDQKPYGETEHDLWYKRSM